MNNALIQITPKQILETFLKNFEVRIQANLSRQELVEIFNNSLSEFEFFCTKQGLREMGFSDSEVRIFYTRLASIIFLALNSEHFNPTLPQLITLCRFKRTTSTIFYASDYRDSSALLIHLTEPQQDQSKRTLRATKLKVLLATISMNDLTDELLAMALELDIQEQLPLLLSWLSETSVLTERGERNRQKLMAKSRHLELGALSPEVVDLLTGSWMLCTYSSSPMKHEFKASLGNILQKFLSRLGVGPSRKTKHRRKQKMTLLIVHEHFGQSHAMSRCFDLIIKGFAGHFRLIGIACADQQNVSAESVYDEIVTFDKGQADLKALIMAIEERAPDIIFYPSLGMQPWSICLASQRLARIQIASVGHPAPSRLNTIDYTFSPSGLPTDKSFVGKIVSVQTPGVSFIPHSGLHRDLPPSAKYKPGGVFRIAINSNIIKLSHRLIDVCSRLVDESSIELEFLFFPAARSHWFDGVSRQIENLLENSTVVRFQEYPEYLKDLSTCHLSLASFPFGNTNCIVDTCLLGIPTIVLSGPELCSKADEEVLATSCYPKDLICKSEEEYFHTAKRFINDCSFREHILKGVDREIARQKLFNAPTEVQGDLYGQVFLHLLRNHNKLRRLDQQVLAYPEMLDKKLPTNKI